eukprot:GAFH01004299.1.p2 GENE.GAFH01004299.1~~GAFH01004299.1.p2  ORF type:complete len:103 (-),score=3.00 GAFH01004299.1:408-716(-)
MVCSPEDHRGNRKLLLTHVLERLPKASFEKAGGNAIKESIDVEPSLGRGLPVLGTHLLGNLASSSLEIFIHVTLHLARHDENEAITNAFGPELLQPFKCLRN